MQILLTENEFKELKIKADCSQYLIRKNNELKSELEELKSKYDKLLIFGVVLSSERLKRN